MILMVDMAHPQYMPPAQQGMPWDIIAVVGIVVVSVVAFLVSHISKKKRFMR